MSLSVVVGYFPGLSETIEEDQAANLHAGSQTRRHLYAILYLLGSLTLFTDINVYP